MQSSVMNLLIIMKYFKPLLLVCNTAELLYLLMLIITRLILCNFAFSYVSSLSSQFFVGFCHYKYLFEIERTFKFNMKLTFFRLVQ